MTLPPRVEARLVRSDGCWSYAGSHTTAGYANYNNGRTNYYVHRLVYEAFVGPIPDGYQIDHLCRNRGCVNPAHLEAVTQAENIRRGAAVAIPKTHCKQGHPWTPENTRQTAKQRVCRTCTRFWTSTAERRRRAMEKAA